MIAPKCDRCKQELTDFGGLAFSPPQRDVCTKWHICKGCWSDLMTWMLTTPLAHVAGIRNEKIN